MTKLGQSTCVRRAKNLAGAIGASGMQLWNRVYLTKKVGINFLIELHMLAEDLAIMASYPSMIWGYK